MEFSQIIETLRAQEQEFEVQLAKVRAAREALESTSAVTVVAPTPAHRGPRLGRPPSSANRGPGRPRKTAATSAAATKSAGGRRGPRRFSAETRAKMAAAQRARWAKARSEQGKK